MCYINIIASYLYSCIQTRMGLYFFIHTSIIELLHIDKTVFSLEVLSWKRNILQKPWLLYGAGTWVVLWLTLPQLIPFAFKQLSHSEHKHPLVKSSFQFLH